MDLDIEIEAERPERFEIFNFKEEEAQAKFKSLTSDTKDFTNCFEDETPLLEQIDKWRQVLKTYCSKDKDQKEVHQTNKTTHGKLN